MAIETPELQFPTKRSVGDVWRVYLAKGFLTPTFLIPYVFAICAAPLLLVFGSEASRRVALVGLVFCVLAPVAYSFALWRVFAADPTITATTNLSV